MNLVTYLEGLPALTLARLYESHWTCQAVLRSLPPLAKQYILRLLFVDKPLSLELLQSWAEPGSASKHEVAIDKLLGLQLLQRVHAGMVAAGGMEGLGAGTALQGLADGRLVVMNPNFKQQLRSAVTGRLFSTLHASEEPTLSGMSPTAAQLDAYAAAQWELLLLYVAGSASRPPELPKGMGLAPLNLKHMVASARLLSGGSVTAAGFKFLLMDTYHQLWVLLKDYIDAAERKSGEELSSLISFLLQLGFRQIGVPWTLDSVTPMQRTIAGHMCQLGLLMPLQQRRVGAGADLIVCPTRMAAALSGATASAGPAAGPGARAQQQQQLSQGFIVVETNYRVYAYTDSALQQTILRMFVRAEVQLPGMFVGTLTRESVTGALETGIGAEQIVTYLQQHAHPQVEHRVPVVPRVVADQIRLWQAELNRVVITDAVLYHQFEQDNYFASSATFARSRGLWLWDDGGTPGQLVARANGHDAMREYIKSIKTG